jgi:catechol 2,3-dioxygenase-like lactoylglutathione lyase family enzyme
MKTNALVPELSISNFETSIRFYRDILGFSIEYQRSEEGFAMLSLGASQIMIDQINKGRTWKTGDFTYPLGRGVNFQIEVPSIDPLLKSLKKKNIQLFMKPEEKWYAKGNIQVGHKQFLVQDPDGYVLRFFENLGTKKL